MPKEIVTPEMVDLQLEDGEGLPWYDEEDSLSEFIADGAPELAEGEDEAASEDEPTGDPRDEPCDCYERVHVEKSPGRWVDKMVKRGGCCG